MNSEMSSKSGVAGWLDRVFHLSENNTSVKREFLAGLTTFVAMAYILFVNPSVLGDAGIYSFISIINFYNCFICYSWLFVDGLFSKLSHCNRTRFR